MGRARLRVNAIADPNSSWRQLANNLSHSCLSGGAILVPTPSSDMYITCPTHVYSKSTSTCFFGRLVMCLEVDFFKYIFLMLTELLQYVHLCFASDLGSFLTLFLQIVFLPQPLSPLLPIVMPYIGPFEISHRSLTHHKYRKTAGCLELYLFSIVSRW